MGPINCTAWKNNFWIILEPCHYNFWSAGLSVVHENSCSSMEDVTPRFGWLRFPLHLTEVWPCLVVATPDLQVLRSLLWCKDLVSNAPNKRPNKRGSLEEQFWDRATTIWTVAAVRLAIQWWLPSTTRKLCRWPWNVKSAFRKAELRKHEAGLHSENRWLAVATL